jgi:hypothetical protein
MLRKASLFTLVLVLAASATAQDADCRFQWKKGQVLVYTTQHVTHVTELVDGKKSQHSSSIDVVKRWQVADIDAQGVATLQMAIVSMRNEQTRPDGKTLLFDSADLDKSTPELRDLSKHMGKTVAELRLDSQGRIWEVKQGSKSKFESDPPFAVILPGKSLAEGAVWVRNYKITLDPPAGTGEQFDAQQKYLCSKVSGNQATIAISTTIKSPAQSFQEKQPLMQKELSGHAVIDCARGVLVSVHMSVDKTIENHQGKDSSYTFRTTFSEKLQEGDGIVQTRNR